jgi:hypothetical protein
MAKRLTARLPLMLTWTQMVCLSFIFILCSQSLSGDEVTTIGTNRGNELCAVQEMAVAVEPVSADDDINMDEIGICYVIFFIFYLKIYQMKGEKYLAQPQLLWLLAARQP